MARDAAVLTVDYFSIKIPFVWFANWLHLWTIKFPRLFCCYESIPKWGQHCNLHVEHSFHLSLMQILKEFVW